jgi:nucleoside-diphosphate-sugar epimerase
MKSGSKVLITGGFGYIGSVLSGQLLATGFRVVVIDNLRHKQIPPKELLDHPNLSFHQTDLLDHAKVREILHKESIKSIVHLAAIASVPECEASPKISRQINVDVPQSLYVMAEEAGIETFVYASTCSVYEAAKEENAVDETTQVQPNSVYGQQKVEMEKWLTAQKSPVECKILRFATACGMSPIMRWDLPVQDFTRTLRSGKALEVYGANTWRPYCHVKDIARAVELTLNSAPTQTGSSIINIGSNQQNHQKKELIQLIKNKCNKGTVIITNHPGDGRDYRVDFSKCAEELHFTTEIGVEETIDEVLLYLA